MHLLISLFIAPPKQQVTSLTNKISYGIAYLLCAAFSSTWLRTHSRSYNTAGDHFFFSSPPTTRNSRGYRGIRHSPGCCAQSAQPEGEPRAAFKGVSSVPLTRDGEISASRRLLWPRGAHIHSTKDEWRPFTINGERCAPDSFEWQSGGGFIFLLLPFSPRHSAYWIYKSSAILS